MGATGERRRQDIQKLEALCQQSRGKINLLSRKGDPVRELVIELRFRTAPSSDYPARVQDATQIRIELPDRYPFEGPKASVMTPILHPNVFPSGQICLGNKWIATENLSLFVKRLALIVTFDQSVLNEASPANAQALKWYRTARGQHPAAFPTDKVILIESAAETPKKMEWNDVARAAPPVFRAEISCPKCGTRLRVPSGKRGKVKCPACSTVFEAES